MHKKKKQIISLTFCNDTSNWITFEVKFNIHVFSLKIIIIEKYLYMSTCTRTQHVHVYPTLRPQIKAEEFVGLSICTLTFYIIS